MIKVRKAKNVVRFPEHWVISEEFRPEGKGLLTPGREFTVTGNRGRCRFRHHVTNTRTGESWVEAWDKYRRFRSFDPSRIRVVHTRSAKLRESA